MSEAELPVAVGAPRVGLVGWGSQTRAVLAAIGMEPASVPAFQPPGPRWVGSHGHMVPTLEALFGVADTILVEGGLSELEPLLPLMRLAITDRHVLVLTGPEPRLAPLLEHLTERKLARCLAVTMLPDAPPLLAYHATPYLSGTDVAALRALLSPTGEALELDSEARFEIVAGLAGIAPAAFFTMMDAMADGALMMGLPRPAALKFTAAVLHRAAAAVLSGETAPAELREAALAGGSAAAGLMALETAGIRGLMMRAVKETMEALHARDGVPPDPPL